MMAATVSQAMTHLRMRDIFEGKAFVKLYATAREAQRNLAVRRVEASTIA
jgi:hypothetical protein